MNTLNLPRGYSYDGPYISNRKNKKLYVILNTPGGARKVIHFGAKGMSDYTIHHDESRRDRFWKRMSGIKKENGELYIDDPESPLFWSARILW